MDSASRSKRRPVGKAVKPPVGWIIGVDGGGSKTVAVVADDQGRIKGRGEAGTSNHHVVGWRAAFAAIAQAIGSANAEAGATKQRALSACVGIAGADSVKDQGHALAWLKRQGLADHNLVVNDGALLLGATGQQEGVAVVSGTGSIAWGRNTLGRHARSGGWGHLIGDEGSGYQLSIEAMRHTVTAADGREPWGPLPQAVLRFYGCKDPAGLLPLIYGPQVTKAELARLAPVVFRLAGRGDPLARRLVDDAAAALAALVKAVSRELGLRRPPLAFGGSLLVRQKALRDALLGHLRGSIGKVVVVRDPARGAVQLAREQIET
ncbi:MAG: BadF/BadG/BcrA/BcrD ATPase family protein [Deltaproteobacteria bacterium]|nr:BadF/BadG/BcrA/BcrD ATPase family protein [Deltaproteobacteria bacterium]